MRCIQAWTRPRRVWFISAVFLALGIILYWKRQCFRASDWMVLLGAGITALVILWQGTLVVRQIQLQAILDLDKEWNSEEMLECRRSAWKRSGTPNLECIESVLEFLEKVSSLEERGIISKNLIWDTVGWYVWRYYIYCGRTIVQLRKKWTETYDPTLYQDLQKLCRKLIAMEIRERNKRGRTPKSSRLTVWKVVRELEKTRTEFVRGERGSDDG